MLAYLFNILLPALAILSTALWLKSCIVIVRQKHVALIETFGRYSGFRTAGIGVRWPYPFSAVAAVVNMQQRQLNHDVAVKTKDNAFVTFPVAIQYLVTDAAKAYYELANPQEQIAAYVLNTVRTEAATLNFDDLYTSRDQIAAAVQNALQTNMGTFGYKIVAVLVDQPQPSPEVQAAFNKVIASVRLREAAENEGAANRIRMVAQADAEKESKRLQGEGIAAQRKAIADGLKESVTALSDLTGLDETTVIGVLMMTNQFDAIRDAAQKGNLIVMPYTGDAALTDLSRLITALAATRKPPETAAITTTSAHTLHPEPASA